MLTARSRNCDIFIIQSRPCHPISSHYYETTTPIHISRPNKHFITLELPTRPENHPIRGPSQLPPIHNLYLLHPSPSATPAIPSARRPESTSTKSLNPNQNSLFL